MSAPVPIEAKADLETYRQALFGAAVAAEKAYDRAAIEARTKCLEMASSACRAQGNHNTKQILELAGEFASFAIGDNRKAPAKRGRPKKTG